METIEIKRQKTQEEIIGELNVFIHTRLRTGMSYENIYKSLLEYGIESNFAKELLDNKVETLDNYDQAFMYRLLNVFKKLKKQDSKYQKIRVGATFSGGYAIPNDLDGIEAVISIGIDNDVSFDRYFADRGLDCYQYDPTIDKLPYEHEKFHFNKVGLGPIDTIENGIEFINLNSIIDKNNLNECNNLLLKIDIEGAEWEAFNVLHHADLLRYRIIVMELHWLTKLCTMSPHFEMVEKIMNMITLNHTCVHNYAPTWGQILIEQGVLIQDGYEVTFLRNDRSNFSPSIEPTPSALDNPLKEHNKKLLFTPTL
ncbi:MAG: FkbM family methyltransferase [Magnetococcus sp. YQC-3]